MSVEFKSRVTRGPETGLWLSPHKYKDGSFVASKTRFERDYVHLTSVNEIEEMVNQGYSIRMSNVDSKNHKSPSLVRPENIEIVRD